MEAREPARLPANPFHELAWVIGEPTIGAGDRKSVV